MSFEHKLTTKNKSDP